MALDPDHTSGLNSLIEQDSFWSASEELVDEEELEYSKGSEGEDEGTAARAWDSTCQQAFPWDGRSSLMVCVDGEQQIWYQARVVQFHNNHYLLSWPGEPSTLMVCSMHTISELEYSLEVEFAPHGDATLKVRADHFFWVSIGLVRRLHRMAIHQKAVGTLNFG